MSDLSLARPGAVLAYEDVGTGPVVGYSHGMLLSRAAEDALGLLDWTALTRRRRLVRYDARGHGTSTGRPVAGDYTWPNLADDLLAVADLIRDGRPVDWIGGSMGCGSLLWAATRAPERFRRLVLEIPPTTGETRIAAATMYRAGADLVERDGKAAWVAALRQYPPPDVFTEIPGFAIEVDITGPLLPSVLRGAALSDLPDASELAALAPPTLVLSWDTDPVHPVSTARFLAETLPNARLHVSGTVADIRTWPDRIGAFLDEAR